MTRPAVLALLLAAVPAAAKDLDAKTVTKLSRPGAFSADIRGVASFRVPQGYRWAAEGNLPELAKAAELTVVGTEAGAVLPDDGKWLAFVIPAKEDPLAGAADPKAVPAESLLTWQERYSAGRRKLSGSASATGGWTHVPNWDAEKKWLTMGVRLTPGGGESGPDLVRYQVFVYGDGGPVCLEAYAPIGTGAYDYQKVPDALAKLAGEVSFAKAAAEPAAEEGDDAVIYYGKMIGGGVLGTVVVAVLFWPRNRGRAAAPAKRGPGLPR